LHRAPDKGEEPKAQGVKGTLSLREALDRLLVNTGYRYELINERMVRVWAADTASTAPPNGEEKKKLGENERPLAVAQSRPRGEEEAATTQNTTGPRKNDSSQPRESILEEVLVTGSHISGSEPTDPTITLTRQDLTNSGRISLQSALETLPQNFSALSF